MGNTTNQTKNIALLINNKQFCYDRLEKWNNSDIQLEPINADRIQFEAKNKVKGSENDLKWEQLSSEIAKIKSKNNDPSDKLISLWIRKSNQNGSDFVICFKLNDKFVQCLKRLFPSSSNAIKIEGSFTLYEEWCDWSDGDRWDEYPNIPSEYFLSPITSGDLEFDGKFDIGNTTGDLGLLCDSAFHLTYADCQLHINLTVFIEWEGIVQNVGGQPLHLDPGALLSKMFSSDSTKDLTIVVRSGREVKCHKVILAAHSTVLASMVSSATSVKDSKTGKIEMRELTENGANYLLQYFYGMPIPLNNLSSHMALELFQTAHKYNLPEMENAIGKLFLEKESEWFTADVALGLYFSMRKLDCGGELKDLSLKILTRNPEEVKKCRRYQQLTQKEALDLLWILFETK